MTVWFTALPRGKLLWTVCQLEYSHALTSTSLTLSNSRQLMTMLSMHSTAACRRLLGSAHGYGLCRCYRRSLKLAEVAAKDFRKQFAKFAIHLGDIVDCQQDMAAAEHGSATLAYRYALDQAIKAFDHFTTGTTYHVVGNHCISAFGRKVVQERLAMKGPGDRCYYSFVPSPRLRMIVLDTFDVALIGNESTSPEYREAVKLLERSTQHEVCTPGTGISGIAHHLRHACHDVPPTADDHLQEPRSHLDPTDLRRRWKAWNGAVGKAQLEWLRRQLAEAQQQRQKVIICSHCPLHPRSAGDRAGSLLWNYEDVLAMIAEADVVIATLSGVPH